MRIILLGAPGAGKGTIAKLLTEHDGSAQISTGDILRNAIKTGSDLGKKAKEYMDRGDLVPDSLIMEIMEARLQETDCAKGFILDGFPRTIPQAQELENLLDKLGIHLDFVVNLEVPKDIILDRLTTRRTCSNATCQEIYNIKSAPPNPDGSCKKCGAPTIQRDDETVTAINNRLDVYNEKTAPLIGFYEKLGMLNNIASLNSQDTATAVVRSLSGKACVGCCCGS